MDRGWSGTCKNRRRLWVPETVSDGGGRAAPRAHIIQGEKGRRDDKSCFNAHNAVYDRRVLVVLIQGAC